jgi:lipopolysaccharide transport system ATP-binding protein
MKTTVIRVENVGKKYIIGSADNAKYSTLRDVIAENAASIVKRLFSKDKVQQSRKKDFWALKDISFEVKQGDRIGIIGRNGAGKSTLLKVVSRITEPTTGRVSIKGRIASLLEVGTGFHPELSGRENIYLNGAILGMTKEEIKKRFDEIVAFAEIDQFLETPVKRYSSGMYVRLAFAVAAHLETEILIVDEVLAVGDMQFQKKCLGKMKDVDKEGRTLLFVSHNMGAVEQLCSSAILLKNGAIANMSNDVPSIIKDYVFTHDSSDAPCYWENPSTDEFDNDYFKPLKFYFSDETGREIRQMPVRNDEDIWINIVGEVRKLDPALYFGIGVFTEAEIFLFGSMFFDGHPDVWPEIKLGYNTLKCKLPKHTFNEGVYKVEVHGGLLHKQFYFYPGMNNPKIFFEIKGGLSESPLWFEKRLGLFAPIFEWTN